MLAIILFTILVSAKIKKNKKQVSEYQSKYNQYMNKFEIEEARNFNLSKLETGISKMITRISKLALTYDNKAEAIFSGKKAYQEMLD